MDVSYFIASHMHVWSSVQFGPQRQHNLSGFRAYLRFASRFKGLLLDMFKIQLPNKAGYFSVKFQAAALQSTAAKTMKSPLTLQRPANVPQDILLWARDHFAWHIKHTPVETEKAFAQYVYQQQEENKKKPLPLDRLKIFYNGNWVVFCFLGFLAI